MAGTIKCPKCKAEQPKQPICSICGFDIRAYALSRQQQKAQPPMITCPQCKAKVPKQPICSSCGFDIRAYALSRQKQKAAPAQGQPSAAPVQPSPDISSDGILQLGDLFSQTWEIFKQRWGPLLVLYLLSGLFAVMFFVLPAVIGMVLASLLSDFKGPITLVTFSLAGLLAYLGACWGMASLVAATVDSSLGIKEALGRGKRMLLSYLWVTILAGIAITGGFMLFIVPGVLFLMWAFAAQFIIFSEEERGMNALLKSREYVRGYGGDTFVKLLVIFICMVVAGFVPLGQLIFFPFLMIFLYRMYEDLRQVKGVVVPYSSSFRSKFAWIGTGLIGFILPVILVAVVLVPVMKRSLPTFQEAFESGSFSQDFTSPSGSKPSPGPSSGGIRPYEYERIVGTWSGRGPDSNSGWQFVFTPDYRAFVTTPEGEQAIADTSEVFFDLGIEPGSDVVRVPPGASMLDFVILSSFNASDIGKKSLGVYQLSFDKEMTLCFSRAGLHKRPVEYRTTDDFACFELDLVSRDTAVAAMPGGTGAATLILDATTFAPGQQIQVTFSAPSYPSNAWVGIIPSHVQHGSESTNDQYDLTYQYLSGRTSGTLTFTAPNEHGTYDFRLHDTDSNGSEVASVTFSVSGNTAPVSQSSGTAIARTTKDSYAPNESIIIEYSGFPGNSQDWITVIEASAADNTYGDWFYTGGKTSGTYNFNGRGSGTYEIRGYFNWPDGGYTVQTRHRFTVGGSTGSAAPSGSSGGGFGESSGQPTATGEATIVIDGKTVNYILKTGFFSETNFNDPMKAQVQFQLPGEDFSNAQRVEMALDATKTGDHYVNGQAVQDSFMGSELVNIGNSTSRGYEAKLQWVADGGQIYFPKGDCIIRITSAYTGGAGSMFSGTVENCPVHSAGIDRHISRFDFSMRGVPSR